MKTIHSLIIANILCAINLNYVTAQGHRMQRMTNPSGRGLLPCGHCEQPATISSETAIAQHEMGQPLTISGTIYQPDHVTPVPNVTLLFYHTNSAGHYNPQDDPLNPLLRGWVKTDYKGRYQFHTIKPGPYPQLNTPAHIHVQLYAKGLPEDFIDDCYFKGDPLIKPEDIAKNKGLEYFSPIIVLVRNKEGVLIGRRNIVLKTHTQ